MAKNNPQIGTMDCPVCEQVFNRQTTVALQLQKEGQGMAYFICDGRADPDGSSCGSRLTMGSAPTQRTKAMIAKAERAPDPKPETETRQIEGEDDGATSERSGNDETGSDDETDTFLA